MGELDALPTDIILRRITFIEDEIENEERTDKLAVLEDELNAHKRELRRRSLKEEYDKKWELR